MPLPVERMSPPCLFMDSTFLKTRKPINLRENNNNNRKKTNNNKTGNSVSAISTLFLSRTFVASRLRRFVLTHTPNAWFPLYLWDSGTRLLFIRMIILGPCSDDFTHNSLCPQKVLGARKLISMLLCQAFVDFPCR